MLKRRKWIKKLSSLFLVLLVTHFSNAQLDSLLKQNLSLEELMNIEVVSATRSKVKLTKAPANITVVTSNQIKERGYRTLEEVFKDIPGFDFTTGQPSGEYTTHMLFRGIGDVGQTKIVLLIDGIPQNDISNGWFRNIGFDQTMIDIDRIEFISGPGSALFGANAYAGMVNIITKDPLDILETEKKVQIEIKNSIGNYNTYSSEIYSNVKLADDLVLQLSGRYFLTNGDNGLDRNDPGNYFQNNYEPDSVLTTEYGNISNGSRKEIQKGFNTSINNYYFRGKLVKDKFTLGFNVWNRNEGLGSEVVGYEYFTNTDNVPYKAHHTGIHTYIQYDYSVGKKVKLLSRTYFRNSTIKPQTGFVYTYQYQSVDNGLNPATIDKMKGYNGEGYVAGMEHKANITIADNNKLVVGVQAEQKIRQYTGISLGELQDETNSAVNSTFENEQPSIQPMYFSKNGAFYIQDEHSLSENLHLTAGLRYDYDQFYGGKYNPRAAVVYAPVSGFRAKLLYGTAYKAPTIFQRFDEWRGNNNLKSETINTTELELGYLIPKKGILNANLFRNDMKDLIVVAANPDPTKVPIGPNGQYLDYYQNIGNQVVYGFSVNGRINIINDLELFGNFQWLGNDELKPLDNVAQRKLNIGINYAIMEIVNLNVRSNIYSKIKAPSTNWYFYEKTDARIASVGYDYVTEDNPDGYLDGFKVINLTLTSIDLVKGKSYQIEPSVTVRNILNTKYAQIGRQTGSGVRPVDSIQPTIQNPSGFIPAYHPQLGREIYVSLNIIF